MKTEQPLMLWYDKPAQSWQEALPLGNGRIGAMVYHQPQNEILALNEDSLWSGYPHNYGAPGKSSVYQKASRLAMAGHYQDAQKLLESDFLGDFTQTYLPLGDLCLSFSPATDDANSETSGYRRWLDLETATSGCEFEQDGVLFSRECFVSQPRQALVLRLGASKAGQLHFTLSFACQLRHSIQTKNGRLVLQGLCPSHVAPVYVNEKEPVVYEDAPEKKGMRFMAIASVELQNGQLEEEDGLLRVRNADSAVIRLCAQTSFNSPFRQPYTNGKPYEELCLADMENSQKYSYDALKAEHLADYTALFKRVDLQLGKGNETLPTNQRLQKGPEGDNSLYTLLFQYGRYLMIASSRPGTTATNLQGIWNRELRPPWSSNYTLNINTTMNYWPSEVCNLPELHAPLFALLQTLQQSGAETARTYYGANGYVAHHNTDVWGLSNPVGKVGEETAAWAYWPMAPGWLARHTYEHYEYSGDMTFLRETAYPLIQGAAAFYLDVLQPDESGYLVFCPATSPENKFMLDGRRCAVARSSTMNTAIIRETLMNLLACYEKLGIEDALASRAKNALEQLPPYRIAANGTLLEWEEELEESEPTHRHLSHLYGLYPGADIRPHTSPALAEACRKTLQRRGGKTTGWALAWRAALYARLGDGNTALGMLARQLYPVSASQTGYEGPGGSYPNLLSACPPLQIDANFGAPAALAEMLLQSETGALWLLPALPAAFATGHVRGLRAKGGLCCGITFKNGTLEQAEIDSETDAELQIHYAGRFCHRTVRAGERLHVKPGDFV